MPKQRASIASVPKPFALLAAGGLATSVTLTAPLTLTWDDGSPGGLVDATWQPQAFQVYSLYPGTARTVDTGSKTWLIVALQGVSDHAVLIRESDCANLDALLGSTTQKWAILYRIHGTDLILFQQGSRPGGGVAFTGDNILTVISAPGATYCHLIQKAGTVYLTGTDWHNLFAYDQTGWIPSKLSPWPPPGNVGIAAGFWGTKPEAMDATTSVTPAPPYDVAFRLPFTVTPAKFALIRGGVFIADVRGVTSVWFNGVSFGTFPTDTVVTVYIHPIYFAYNNLLAVELDLLVADHSPVLGVDLAPAINYEFFVY